MYLHVLDPIRTTSDSKCRISLCKRLYRNDYRTDIELHSYIFVMPQLHLIKCIQNEMWFGPIRQCDKVLVTFCIRSVLSVRITSVTQIAHSERWQLSHTDFSLFCTGTWTVPIQNEICLYNSLPYTDSYSI